MIGQGNYVYPAPIITEEFHYGLYPVDFVLETVIVAGLKWFREDENAPKKVFGHLMSPWLDSKYGEAKIREIAAFIKKYDIRIVQSFALIGETLPSISIQLLDGNEMTERAGLADHQQMMDIIDAENNIKGRTEVGYAPMSDNVHIGIHTSDTPDLAKYLYQLVSYILVSFRPTFEERGLHLGTFRATDISRLNDYLPANVYSRFINFTAFSTASFDKGDVPMIERFIGITVPPISEETTSEEFNNVELGLHLSDISGGENG